MKQNIIEMDNQNIRKNILNQKLQIFEVKQFAELENYYKLQCRQALSDYKKWKRGHLEETDTVQMLYGQLDGIILRHRAQTTASAYWIVRCDYRCVLKSYLSNIPTYIK